MLDSILRALGTKAPADRAARLAACALPRPLDLGEARRVLVFAPHPDDETLGCGGTLARLAPNCAIKVILVTDGSGAGQLPPGSDRIRQAEFQRALSVLGVNDIEGLDQPDGFFAPSEPLRRKVLALLSDFRPDWVFLPSPLDYHRDHARLALFLEPLCQHAESVQSLLFYEIWAPVPATHVVDITDQAELKQRALACHITALACGDYARAIEGLNRYRGLYLGRGRLAEAFWVEPAGARSCFRRFSAAALDLLERLNNS